jgi:3-oxoacyl-[acyl-carrier protein] reductase
MSATLSSTRSTSLTLQGKVAIVTGASRGIGAGIALELARRGANVSFSHCQK